MIRKIKEFLQAIKEILEKFDMAFPETSQNIQLSFIYFFAIVDLLYGILTNVFALGYSPEFLMPFMPIISDILQSPFFKIWSSPEKVFLLSYVVIELMLIRKTLNFSKLVKYNVLLIFALLMVQGLLISYWDLLCHRAISTPMPVWNSDGGSLIGLNRNIAISLFLSTFVFFVIIYAYFYIKALSGIFGTFPGLEWLTDSVAFWLRIKTPTMRFGRRKKQKGK